MKIVVIGGTGLLGSKVVTALGELGHDAVAAAPSTGVDTITGAGLADALAGADVVADLSNSPSWEDDAVLEFFRTSTTNLLAAAGQAGVRHYLAMSIVGADRLPDSGYLRAKVAQEQLVEAGGLPYTIVRATQFFEFVPAIADSATEGDAVHMAPVGFQPIAAADLADKVARIAVAAPVNGVVEIAGPDRVPMDEFFRNALARRDDARRVVTDVHARYFGTELADGSLVPAGEAVLGTTRFAEWTGAAGAYPV